jgi:hypothetical protein
VIYQRIPVSGYYRIAPVVLDDGDRLRCTLSYYDYGVISVEFEVPFDFDWTGLVSLLRILNGCATDREESRRGRPRL